MATTTESPLIVSVAPDHLSVSVRFKHGLIPDELSAAAVLAALEPSKIALTEEVHSRIAAFLESLRLKAHAPDASFVVATGVAPTEGEDGRFEWAPHLEERARAWRDPEAASVDFYSISTIVTVRAGDVIGRVVPPTYGRSGTDVHGNAIRPKQRVREVVLRYGVELAEDGATVRATAPGKVVYRDHVLFINEVIDIPGDVDFSTGHVDVTTELNVAGGVKDRFRVKTVRSVTIGGSVEAADLEAEGDITIRGGVHQRNRAKIVAGGSITAKFCSESNLRAGGDICLVKESLNSHLHTDRRLVMPHGALIGGETYARCGAEVRTLGSDAGVPTRIHIGAHLDELRAWDQVSKDNVRRRAQLAKLRQQVDPLLSEFRRLGEQQKEQVAQLLAEIQALEAEINRTEEEVMRARAAVRDLAPAVKVNNVVHQRVLVIIDDRVVTIHDEASGPLRIERRRLQNYSAICAVHQVSGSVRELPARRLDLVTALPETSAPQTRFDSA